MKNFIIFALAVVPVIVCSSRAGAADWTPAGPAKLFSNSEGIKVIVVPLKPEADKQRAVVSIEGTNSSLDGRPVAVQINEYGRRSEFVRYNSRGIVLTTEGPGNRTYLLPVPGRRGAVSVFYDAKRSGTIKTEKLLIRLLTRRDGAASPRKTLEQADKALFAQKLKLANKTCGTSLSATIDFAGFSDAALKKLDVGKACGAVLDAVAGLCSDDIGKTAVRGQIKNISCVLGKTNQLVLKKKKLGFSTAVDVPDQFEFAYDWLENNLD